jgi:hypothetical protein
MSVASMFELPALLFGVLYAGGAVMTEVMVCVR